MEIRSNPIAFRGNIVPKGEISPEIYSLFADLGKKIKSKEVADVFVSEDDKAIYLATKFENSADQSSKPLKLFISPIPKQLLTEGWVNVVNVYKQMKVEYLLDKAGFLIDFAKYPEARICN